VSVTAHDEGGASDQGGASGQVVKIAGMG